MAIANEAVGRRRLSSDVRAKISKFCEALLAGTVDLRVAVELFGGIAPAEGYATAGFEEAKVTRARGARWPPGRTSSRRWHSSSLTMDTPRFVAPFPK